MAVYSKFQAEMDYTRVCLQTNEGGRGIKSKEIKRKRKPN